MPSLIFLRYPGEARSHPKPIQSPRDSAPRRNRSLKMSRSSPAPASLCHAGRAQSSRYGPRSGRPPARRRWPQRTLSRRLPPPTDPVSLSQDYAAGRARLYDRIQDIAARQLALLLDVSERTGASLGQMRAIGEHESAAPQAIRIQTTLNTLELLEQPVKKTAWRDKQRRKRNSYKTPPFAGQMDEATNAALDRFQLRRGQAGTSGVLDAVTQRLLLLEDLRPEPLGPLSGRPGLSCAISRRAERPRGNRNPDRNRDRNRDRNWNRN